MDELTRILWLNRKAKAPVETLVMDVRPPYDCPSCEGHRASYDPKVGTRWLHRSQVTCGMNGEPWKIWKVTTTCGDCSGKTNWLIDPDKPANTFKPNEKERTTDFPFDNPSDTLYLGGKYSYTLDEITTESKPSAYELEHLSDLEKSDTPFEDFPRLYGETDFQAYIRWLKHNSNKRKGKQDDNDAS